MKKITSIFLAIIIAVSMCAIAVFAAEATLTLSSDMESAKVGDVVTVSANINENSNLGVLTFTMNYNPNELEYVEGSFVNNGLFGFADTNDKTSGKLFYTGLTGTAVNTAGAVITAQFKVLKVNSQITVSVEEAYDGNDNDITAELSENSVGVIIKCSHENQESGKCNDCGEVLQSEKIETVYLKNQIRFDKNDDGTYAGTFDYRTVVEITNVTKLFDDVNDIVDTADGDGILEAGFIFNKGSAIDMDVALEQIKGGEEAYAQVDDAYISTSVVSEKYVMACVVHDIPTENVNTSLSTLAYIIYTQNGETKYAMFEEPYTTSFVGLYENYYNSVFPS